MKIIQQPEKIVPGKLMALRNVYLNIFADKLEFVYVPVSEDGLEIGGEAENVTLKASECGSVTIKELVDGEMTKVPTAQIAGEVVPEKAPVTEEPII